MSGHKPEALDAQLLGPQTASDNPNDVAPGRINLQTLQPHGCLHASWGMFMACFTPAEAPSDTQEG